MEPEAVEQLNVENREKVAVGQARLVAWKDIMDNPPPQLKISPITTMIPHKPPQIQGDPGPVFPFASEEWRNAGCSER